MAPAGRPCRTPRRSAPDRGAAMRLDCMPSPPGRVWARATIGTSLRPLMASYRALLHPGAPPGTPSAWETPPARLPGRLTIKGRFTVDDDRRRDLQQQARRLGFADLRSCLEALLGDRWSIPQLAAHLGTTQAAIRRAITDYHIAQPSRREQLARQRQRVAQRRAAARVAKLGFQGVRAYLVDRLAVRAWTLEEVVAELGTAPSTLRRPLDKHGVRRWRRPGGSAPPPQLQADPSSRRRRSGSAARHAWPNSASQGWRSTCKIGTCDGAGRCGGSALNSV
jgi:hypothetical protein